jgi:hypothetical protein
MYKHYSNGISDTENRAERFLGERHYKTRKHRTELTPHATQYFSLMFMFLKGNSFSFDIHQGCEL